MTYPGGVSVPTDSASARYGPMPYGDDWAAWSRWAAELPAARALGLELIEMGSGLARMHAERSVFPLNPNGAVHGGLLACMADHCAGMAVATMLDEGQLSATATLHASYLRPGVLPLTLEAIVERRGRLIFANATISSAGHPCTRATGTWIPIAAS